MIADVNDGIWKWPFGEGFCPWHGDWRCRLVVGPHITIGWNPFVGPLRELWGGPTNGCCSKGGHGHRLQAGGFRSSALSTTCGEGQRTGARSQGGHGHTLQAGVIRSSALSATCGEGQRTGFHPHLSRGWPLTRRSILMRLPDGAGINPTNSSQPVCLELRGLPYLQICLPLRHPIAVRRQPRREQGRCFQLVCRAK
jgi:hypothetical protein